MLNKKKKDSAVAPENVDSLLTSLLNRAKEKRKSHEETAEVSRAVYAGMPMTIGKAELPPSNWNQLKKVVQNNTARVINGNPVPHIRSNDPEADAEKAEAYQKRVQKKLRNSNLPSLLRKQTQDTFLSGNGYLEINESGDLRYVSYFDVYVDNAKGDPTDLTECRYIFIRRLTEKELFIDLYGDDLKKNGVDPGTVLTCEDDIPGRSQVGTASPGDFYLKYDRSLSVVESATGLNYALTDSFSGENTISDDSLVEHWTVYLMSENSPNGFERISFYKNTVFRRENMPKWMFQQPLFCLAGDCVNGQFYQPSLLTSVGYTQLEVNWIASKISQAISHQAGPIRIVDKTEADIPDNAGFDWRPGSIWKTVQNGKGLDFAEHPTLPQQYINHRIQIMEESDQQELVDIQQGTAPSGVTSGVALQTLESQANVRLALINTLRDEELRDIGMMILLIDLDDEKQLAIEKFSTDKKEADGTLPSPEEFTDENLIQYMDPDYVIYDEENKPVKIVTPQELMDDYNFTWTITPSTSKDRKMGELFVAINSAASIVQGDPRVALMVVDVAGIITGNVDEANEIKDVLGEYFKNIAAIEEQDPEQAPVDGQGLTEAPAGPQLPPEIMKRMGLSQEKQSPEALEAEGAIKDRL